MCKMRVLGLAAGALLSFGVAAAQAAQESQAEAAIGEEGVAKAAYHEGDTTVRRGNIYGSHGVIGHTTIISRGYYGAARHRAHHAHRYQRRHRGYYGVAGYYPRYYSHRYYPRPVLAYGYDATTRYYPQYYAHRYYPMRPVIAGQYYGATGYYPQYYAHRYYPARPVLVAPGYYPGYPVAAAAPVGATDPLSSVFAPTNWSASCINGRVCAGYSYYRGVPICRVWAACNY